MFRIECTNYAWRAAFDWKFDTEGEARSEAQRLSRVWPSIEVRRISDNQIILTLKDGKVVANREVAS